MEQTGTRIFRVVRNFLFSIVNKEFLIFLFFLLVSATFWVLTTLNETYEREIAVPLKLVNVPKGVVITSDMNDTLKVTIRDRGYFLFAYKFGNIIQLFSQKVVYSGKKSGSFTCEQVQNRTRCIRQY